ncbi:ATP-binding protein [Pseudomonas oryzihabitans]|uniref:ATP-binding protein n=1 Tax=Pseudomonas oryzihabitans TaxID=47885 RepID=UPI002858F5C2|nr:ATP-binding protein [Pseudomonas psychrotolerans]MDR6677438.1 light-regulated signal transduction histidine kinase (bacteriophytochrome) [Pseudomonas psychrotolerans]
MALESPSTTQPEALADCANEPIHIPGSIQEHGFLFAVEEPDLRIVQASANVREYLGVAVEEVLGRTLGELLPRMDLPAMIAALDQEEQNPSYLGDVTLGPRDQVFALFMHRFEKVLIVEFEAPVDSSLGLNTLYPMVRVFIEQLHQAETVEAIAKLAVHEAKRISGFDHAMIYRFDEDGHGQVLAEERDPGVPSYLGLRFPASDIPAQARRLYLANRIRVIGNAYYQPSPLQPQDNPLTGQPLDLSFAHLRSVSPVHLQYMRNMGTLASMSVSIVVGDRLWGLVLCHDRQPQRVSFQTRTACELFGRVLSLQLDAAETHAESDRRLALRQSMVQLLSSMADRDSVCQGLLDLPQVYLDFARAQGAAIISSDGTELIGQTPPREQVDELIEWLSTNVKDHYATDNVAKDIAELPKLAQYAAGVLAVPISELHSHYLIWFRAELVQVVNWAGRPTKQESDDGRLSPRQSFVLWQETVRGFSLPWSALEVESALELRSAVRGIVLRKAEEMAELAEELQRSNKELAAFSYSVSHDLRAPLRHIAGYAELLGDIEGGKLSERGRRFLENIGSSARFAGSLVDNLLSFSQMGRAAIRYSDVNLTALVEAIREEMAPDYADRQVEWRVGDLPVVIADAAFVHLALRNLLANAIKYSRYADPAVIEIGTQPSESEDIVFVRDNGVGFNMDYVGKLFGVFQRLHHVDEFEGVGIGLASVRRIIERHDGRVWAEGAVGEGATFYFALPKQRPSPLHKR